MSSETALSELRLTTRAEHDRVRTAATSPQAFGAAAPPAPQDDGHIDLPDDVPEEGDTVFDLPLDEPADGADETQPLPL